MSVDPERGNPTMKIGSGSGAPTPARAVKNSAVHTSICLRVLLSVMSGSVAAFGALECIAALVELPGFRVLVPVFVRLAECEAQMVAIDGLSPGEASSARMLHDLVLGKAIGLEIRETPVGIAEARLDGRRHSIGLDRLFLPSDGS